MSERKPITLTITGVFDPDELAVLITLIRGIDQRHPDRHYEMFIDDPDKTLGEAEEALRTMTPELPWRETTFSVHRKQ